MGIRRKSRRQFSRCTPIQQPLNCRCTRTVPGPGFERLSMPIGIVTQERHPVPIPLPHSSLRSWVSFRREIWSQITTKEAIHTIGTPVLDGNDHDNRRSANPQEATRLPVFSNSSLPPSIAGSKQTRMVPLNQQRRRVGNYVIT